MKAALYDFAMRNAGRYDALARSAERTGDDELAGFFRHMRDDDRRSAQRPGGCSPSA